LLQHFDWTLLFIAVLIPVFGLIALYSAGYDPDVVIPVFHSDYLTLQSRIFVRQLIFFGVGLLALGIGASISTRSWQRYAYWIYGLVIVLLIVVLIHGTIAQGSKRWISLGAYTLQPSELMKLALILCMAKF